MKLAYTSPKLTVHGGVEELTQYVGRDLSGDTLFFADGSVADTNNDSRDLTLPSND